MRNDEILSLIQEAFEFASPEQALAVKDLTINSALSEFGVSSIVALEMAGYIEEKLHIQFADDELAQIGNIKGFVNLISQYTKLAA
ncbi:MULTISPECIES: acyl carrier protein [unclassified Nostoc]|uniref:acyl carrier protein n=1 Tax=unclassified Nostoc TaxID=2593658 RepID=UPI002AD22C6B|nr:MULTISPECIES: acyl carrier protein [unclassified Nostoc]MDZ8120922.1 acyl carrier protein [Nostoc sp. CmiVER01]MDZ8226280.1 acyl carrier protein [Nostoc sp. ChiVER01]